MTYTRRSLASLALLAAIGSLPIVEADTPHRRRLAFRPETRRDPVIPDDPPAPRVHDAERIAAAEAKRARKNAKRAAAHRLL